VYTALARKEEASKQVERKFSALVHEKDNESMKLMMKIESLDQAKEEELTKIARLEREMRQTVQIETERLNVIISQKNQKIEELREKNQQIQMEHARI
jgi:ribosomal protein S3